MSLNGKHILIGITGSIAAYKICYLIRSIKNQGGCVKTILTRSGKHFITRTTLEALSGEPVAFDMFEPMSSNRIPHIELARWADCFVVAPATANIIAKTVHGTADDLLSTVILAHPGAIIFAPAMNEAMWNNPVTQANVRRLQELGHWIVSPAVGELACGEEGIGRMADPKEIEKTIITKLDLVASGNRLDLKDKKVLVTLGRTEEPIDPVRYISNRSSGKMGSAIADAALSRGADVTIIAGVHTAPLPQGAKVINVRTAQEMADTVIKEFKNYDVLIMAAAVADYRPIHTAKQKIKKSLSRLTLELEPTEDILAGIAQKKKNTLVVGFSLETDNEIENARKKLKEKHLDMIVVNNPLEPGSGFETDTNRVIIIECGKKPLELPLLPKRTVADRIIDRVVLLLK
jgi:phosphopantothenoylcysteine decarboxylase/phosphopantothenate--cysteine ligase